ncbi:glypican-6-like [Physella acuta]|uniref:glypican-6-like n=1 Tax=Physella acuta TaxID=109671 RepID=UPI0027DDD0E8|nr:glypican-6-like [Physella acuta]
MADTNIKISAAQCLYSCVLFIFLMVSVTTGQTLNTACIEVKKAYSSDKGFNENDVSLTAISGAELSICPMAETCCTRSLEEKLVLLSKKDHTKQMEEAFKLVKNTFTTQTKKFDEFFTELLDKAKSSLHDMFLQTYGLIYQQNAQIFTLLFEDLRKYYKGKDLNLLEVMDSFFSRLLQKMFVLTNANHNFDDEYLSCITERMNELKPFGEVPMKLSVQIKRAFIAARTFVQGLAIGRDVINNVVEIPPTEGCLKAVVKMMHCPRCRGLTSTKPCSNYCMNIMKGCFAHHADLNTLWNAYIEALNGVAARLEGPFNIEIVVDPINVKISEAIMNFQENSEVITQKIFAGCGDPPTSSPENVARLRTRPRPRSKLSSSPPARTPSSPPPGTRRARGGSLRPATSWSGWSVTSRTRSTRPKTSGSIWHTASVTNEQVADTSTVEDCWNGQDRGRYLPEVQKDGILNQISNPEVEVDVTKVNTVVSRQKVQLQLITHRLNIAGKGEDVDWIDTEIEGVLSGSGSGDLELGSGSGDRPPVTDVNPDIDIDNQPNKETKKPTPARPPPERNNPRKPEVPPKADDRENRQRPESSPKPNKPGGRNSASLLSISLGVVVLVLSLHHGLAEIMC